MLKIDTIGMLQLRKDGEQMLLPRSRKTRALLAYLALTGKWHSRQKLCELFWDGPDDPRASLRWSLSKLRPLVNTPGKERLTASRDRIRLHADDIVVDFDGMAALVKDAQSDAELAETWELANQTLLEDCELPSHSGFSSWLTQLRDELGHSRAIMARHLAQSPKAELRWRELWVRRWRADAPFDADAAQLAVKLKRIGGYVDDAATLERSLTRVFREAELPVPDFRSRSPASTLAASPPMGPRDNLPPR